MPNPTKVSVWDITDGLVEAVQAYSESLQGNRGAGDWGGAASREFLKDVFGVLPSNPISAENLAKLKGLAIEANYARANPTKFTVTKKQTQAIENCAAALNPYFEAELDISLDRVAPPVDFVSRAVKDFQTAVTAAQRIYTAPPADLAAKRTAYQANKFAQHDYDQPFDKIRDADLYDTVQNFQMDNAAWDRLAPEPPNNLGDMR